MELLENEKIMIMILRHGTELQKERLLDELKFLSDIDRRVLSVMFDQRYGSVTNERQ